MDNVFSQKTEEIFKAHPYVFIWVISVALVALFYVGKVYAEKETVENLSKDFNSKLGELSLSIEALDAKVDRSFQELKLDGIVTQIYELEGIVGTIDETSRDGARLNALRIQRNQICRDLGLQACDQ